MPRGVSRAKHPEMYSDAGGKSAGKHVGSTRKGRVKTGGRSASGSSRESIISLEPLQQLVNIRGGLTANNTHINHGLLGKVDEVLDFQLSQLVNHVRSIEQEQEQIEDDRADGAVVERGTGAAAAPQFNPPSPVAQPPGFPPPRS